MYRYSVDLFYFPETLGPGACRAILPGDNACPYAGLAAPGGRPGTIVILGHTDRSRGVPTVTEYGIVGYGAETGAPLRAPWAADSGPFVLYGPGPDRADRE